MTLIDAINGRSGRFALGLSRAIGFTTTDLMGLVGGGRLPARLYLALDNRADALEPARDATLDPFPASITLHEILREGARDAVGVERICRVH